MGDVASFNLAISLLVALAPSGLLHSNSRRICQLDSLSSAGNHGGASHGRSLLAVVDVASKRSGRLVAVV